MILTIYFLSTWCRLNVILIEISYFVFFSCHFPTFLCLSLNSSAWCALQQGGSMPNTSSSVPFLLSSSMQSIRSRRTSTCLSSGPLGSGSGLLQSLGSGMVRLTSASGISSPVHQQYNGNTLNSSSNNASINNLNYGGPPTNNNNNTRGGSNYVRKCPSLNITFSTHWLSMCALHTQARLVCKTYSIFCYYL